VIRQIALVASWITAAAVVLAAMYWTFLYTPESNVATLTVSTLLLAAMLVTAAIAVNGALVLATGVSLQSVLPPAVRTVPAFIATALPVALLTLLMLRADGWIARHAGEISAWFIARFGLADVTVLFRVESWLSAWLRWVVLPVTGLSALAAILQTGIGGIRRSAWLARAWHWRMLLLSTAVFVLLIALPWRAAFWQPHGLPPTWIEPALAGLRLVAIGVSIAVGCALIVILVSSAGLQSRDPDRVI
jgi:hypothetical protein